VRWVRRGFCTAPTGERPGARAIPCLHLLRFGGGLNLSRLRLPERRGDGKHNWLPVKIISSHPFYRIEDRASHLYFRRVAGAKPRG